MKIMIDTNVFLDVIFDRQILAEASANVLDLCENSVVNGVISASCITDIFYIVRKNLHSTDAAYDAIGQIMNLVKIGTVSEKQVKSAYSRHTSDFEDCLVAVCAESEHCDCIVTRNKNDFTDTSLKLFTPEEFISSGFQHFPD